MKKITMTSFRLRRVFSIAVLSVLVPLAGFAQEPFTDARDSVATNANPPGFTGTKGDLGNLRDVSISNAGFTADPGEPAINGKPAVRTAWVYFTAGAAGTASVTVSNITSTGARIGVFNIALDYPFLNNSENAKMGEADTTGNPTTTFAVEKDKYYAIQLDSTTAGNIRLIISGGTIITPPPPSANRYNLVVNVYPPGTGTVSVSPEPPEDGYTSGTVVTLTASGTAFQGFTGSANGANTSLNITMNANKTITAHFGTSEDQILMGSSIGQLATWFLKETNKYNGAAILKSPGVGWRVVGTSDLNTDGHKDFIFQSTGGLLAYWLMDGNRLVPPAAAIKDAGSAWRAVGVSDFDADGDDDILFQHSSRSLAVWYLNGTTYTNAAFVRGGISTGDWIVVGVEDFDGDSKGDILFQHPNGQLAVWYMNGIALKGTALAHSAGAGWSIAGLGDFDKDGKTDFLWQNPQRQLVIWLMNGVAYRTGTGRYLNNGAPFGSGWQIYTVK